MICKCRFVTIFWVPAFAGMTFRGTQVNMNEIFSNNGGKLIFRQEGLLTAHKIIHNL